LQERDYESATWNGYLMVTDNPLAKAPIFYSGTVNDPKDPFVAGRCGPGRCQAVYDFIDVVIGPDGTAWGAFVDGCPGGSCAGGAGEAVVGRLVGGPRLK
ncbi:MAG: hypothetical protein ACRD1T_20525, partial [Acidimicrobiia bacterium]